MGEMRTVEVLFFPLRDTQIYFYGYSSFHRLSRGILLGVCRSIVMDSHMMISVGHAAAAAASWCKTDHKCSGDILLRHS